MWPDSNQIRKPSLSRIVIVVVVSTTRLTTLIEVNNARSSEENLLARVLYKRQRKKSGVNSKATDLYSNNVCWHFK